MFLSKKVIICVFSVILVVSLGCGGSDSKKERDLSFGVNLIKNPSFEEWTDSVPDGWKARMIGELSSKDGTANRVKRSSVSKSGNYSCYISGDDTTDKWIGLVQLVPVAEGHDLILSSDIKTESLRKESGHNAYSNVFVRFLDKKGNRVTEEKRFADAFLQRYAGTKEWFRDEKKVTVPPGSHFAEVGVLSTMSGVIYFDNVEAVLREDIPWETKDTRYITFYYLPGHPFPEGAIEKEAEAIEDYARRIDLEEIDGKIHYYYYPNEEEFKRINVVDNYYEGVKWEKKEIHTMKENEDLVVTHMLLYDLGFPPLGLAKGLVFYLRSFKHGWNPHKEAKEDLISKKIEPLHKTILNSKIRNSDLSTTIPAWTSFCAYLITQYGTEKFLKFYREADGIKDAKSFSELFKKIYKRDFNKVDMDWRLWIMRYEPKGESVPMP